MNLPNQKKIADSPNHKSSEQGVLKTYLITGAIRAGAAQVTSGACTTYSTTGDGAEVAARVAAGGGADAVNTAGSGVV